MLLTEKSIVLLATHVTRCFAERECCYQPTLRPCHGDDIVPPRPGCSARFHLRVLYSSSSPEAERKRSFASFFSLKQTRGLWSIMPYSPRIAKHSRANANSPSLDVLLLHPAGLKAVILSEWVHMASRLEVGEVLPCPAPGRTKAPSAAGAGAGAVVVTSMSAGVKDSRGSSSPRPALGPIGEAAQLVEAALQARTAASQGQRFATTKTLFFALSSLNGALRLELRRRAVGQVRQDVRSGLSSVGEHSSSVPRRSVDVQILVPCAEIVSSGRTVL